MSNLKSLFAALLLALACSAGAADPVNLNTATADTLSSEMVGIGPSKAAAIVAHREQHGPFRTVDDLLLVKGIGAATLDKNRDRVTAASR